MAEYARGMEMLGEAGEEPKFVAGTMHLVRFGAHQGDPIWPVDIFDPQAERAAEVFGYLLRDAIDGFPVPLYPRCLFQTMPMHGLFVIVQLESEDEGLTNYRHRVARAPRVRCR
jgi:hypothetical protein